MHRWPDGRAHGLALVTGPDGRELVLRWRTPSAYGTAEGELAATRAAATTGVGPQVVAALPDGSALLLERLPGRPLRAADLADPTTLHRVAAVVRSLHSGPALPAAGDLAQERDRHAVAASVAGLPLPADHGRLTPVADRLLARLRDAAGPLVPCHNDLVPENLVDDGRRVRLVDFEYAAGNPAAVDLAGLALGADLADTDRELLLAHYLDREPTDSERATVDGWLLVLAHAYLPWALLEGGPDAVAWQRRYRAAAVRLGGPEPDRLATDLAASGQRGHHA